MKVIISVFIHTFYNVDPTALELIIIHTQSVICFLRTVITEIEAQGCDGFDMRISV